jgi:hypothetical protein
MSDPTQEPLADAGEIRRRRRKRELIYAAAGVVTGFLLLPLSIYVVGTLLLGPYAGGKSIGVFFADFYGHLASGTVRAWYIALAPYLAIWLLRLCFKRYLFVKSKEPPTVSGPPDEIPAQRKPERARREPFISP